MAPLARRESYRFIKAPLEKMSAPFGLNFVSIANTGLAGGRPTALVHVSAPQRCQHPSGQNQISFLLKITSSLARQGAPSACQRYPRASVSNALSRNMSYQLVGRPSPGRAPYSFVNASLQPGYALLTSRYLSSSFLSKMAPIFRQGTPPVRKRAPRAI